MKLVFLGTSSAIIYYMRFHRIIKLTYDKEQDTFKHIFLIAPSAVLALLTTHNYTVLEVGLLQPRQWQAECLISNQLAWATSKVIASGAAAHAVAKGSVYQYRCHGQCTRTMRLRVSLPIMLCLCSTSWMFCYAGVVDVLNLPGSSSHPAAAHSASTDSKY
jgi:hypothetical protein